MKPKFIIGAAVILLFSIFGFSAFNSAVTPYVSFQEARESSRQVQVMGYLEKGEEWGYNTEEGRLEFSMRDEEKENLMPVVYHGAQPSNFEHADSIVAVGQYDDVDDIFFADRLLVKCPSKYEEGG